MTIEALPFYADRILTSASTSDDYCYLVTPYSVCLVRLEHNRVTEIYTSTLGLTIRDKFKQDKDGKKTKITVKMLTRPSDLLR